MGSGQSGCQIAEELHEAGREVVLACGRASWMPRRFGGHDLIWWLRETGYGDQTVESLPDPRARLWANVLSTGHGGGHDLHLRTLQALGVTLAGHFLGADGMEARFAPDLARERGLGRRALRLVRGPRREGSSAERGLEPSGLDRPRAVRRRRARSGRPLGLRRRDLRGRVPPRLWSWLPWREAFDELGFPIHEDGASTVVPGLYFVGVHFLRKRKSSLLLGVGEDAQIVAAQVAEHAAARASVR